MSFTEAVRTCLNKYVSISGRAPRSEYWWWFLFVILVNIVASILDAVLFGGLAEGSNVTPIQGLAGLGTLLPSICVAGRRLHDRDMSAWWLLLWLVPLVGALILLVLFALRGTEGPNRFGSDPLRS